MKISSVSKIAFWVALATFVTNDSSGVVGQTLIEPANEKTNLEQNVSDHLQWKYINVQLRLKIAANSLKSEEGRTKTEIQFINGLDEPVSIYWVDYKGNEIKYKTLYPRTRYAQQTYVTHPWVVRRVSDNQIVARAVGRVGKQILDIGDREYGNRVSARGPAEAQTPAAAHDPDKVMYAAKRANVRTGPSTAHRKVGLLELGEQVRVTARHGNWFRLEPRGGQRDRFVSARLLTATRPTGARRTNITQDVDRSQTHAPISGPKGAVLAGAKEFWGAMVAGQSVPNTQRIKYPADSYGVAYNFTDQKSAIDKALRECEQIAYHCGTDGNERLAISFNSNADAYDGSYVTERCLTVYKYTSGSMELLSVDYERGEVSSSKISRISRGGYIKVHHHEIYCNER